MLLVLHGHLVMWELVIRRDFGGIDHMWQGCYTLIHRANLATSKITAMNNLTPESKEDALGQLCFLKAWAYFNLVRNYGPVPIFRKSISEGEDMHQARSSVADVYAHIIELLDQAENMYSKNDAGFIEGHASSGAAKALLAKFMQQWHQEQCPSTHCS